MASDSRKFTNKCMNWFENGLVESCSKMKASTHCSSTFFGWKINRNRWKKVNNHVKSHSSVLPNVVENLTFLHCKKHLPKTTFGLRVWEKLLQGGRNGRKPRGMPLKMSSKIDCGSGFWQVVLNEITKELTSFVTLNGQVWQLNCITFVFQVATAISQELMERVISEMKGNQRGAKLLEPKNGKRTCFVETFFDDVGVGASTIPEDLFFWRSISKWSKSGSSTSI